MKVIKNKTINATSTIYSDVINLKYFSSPQRIIGFSYKAVSESGTPNITITLEQSSQSESGFVDSGNPGITVTNETDNINNFTILPLNYARFKVVGNTGNPADTVLNLTVSFWE